MICIQCAASCTGHRVEVTSDEREGIEARAQEMGIVRPVRADGSLRRNAGVCVFLDEDGLCSLHRAGGPAAKPRMCRQYPLVAVRVGNELRLGFDPGCAGARAGWEKGVAPTIGDDTLIHEVPAPHPDEERVLGLLDGPAPLEALGIPDPIEPLPHGLVTEPIGLGSVLRPRLEAMLARPPIPRGETDEAWARESARRLIWLQLAAGAPDQVAAWTLYGALRCRTDAELAAWCRVLRMMAP